MKRRNYLMLSLFMVLSLITSFIPGVNIPVEATLQDASVQNMKKETDIIREKRLQDQNRQSNELRKNNISMQQKNDFDYTIEISESSLKLYDSAEVKVTISENSSNLIEGQVIIKTERNGKIYRDYVFLESESELVFSGEIYVYNERVSGVYDVETLIIYDKQYDHVAYMETELPQDFLTISGTLGGYQPHVDIHFDKGVYGPDEYITMTAFVEDDIIDFQDVYVSIVLNESEDYYSKHFYLDRTAPGVFEGKLYVDEFFRSGTYVIQSVDPYSEEYSINIYQTPEYEEDMEFINYTDDFTESFQVSGTEKDLVKPSILSYKSDRTEISNSEEVTITVEATDDYSGVAEVYVALETEYQEFIFVDLLETEENVYTGTFNPHSDYYEGSEFNIVQITVIDKAGNVAYESWLPKTVIKVNGYRNISEISGENRYQTAIEISKLTNSSDTVILALGTDFPDALAAGPLAYALNAPILLSQQNRISQSTLNEIKRREATEVIILGGPSAISENVIISLNNIGVKNVKRVNGNNRYWTAVAVGEELLKIQALDEYITKEVVLANGNQFADALAAGSMASSGGLPILLTNGTTIHPEVERFLDENRIDLVHVVGGPSVVSDEVIAKLRSKGIEIMRYAGSNRYNTSVDIALKTYPHSDTAFVANGLQFADALAAAPLAANINAPILLVSGDRVPKGVSDLLSDGSMPYLEFINVVGGDAAVSDAVKSSISQIINNR